jgi:hypothetical protein
MAVTLGSLRNIINANKTEYTWVNYLYNGPQIYGYITSSLGADGFRMISGYVTVITASTNYFYIRIPRSLLPALTVIPGTSRVYSPFLTLNYTYTVYGVYNDYNVYYPTDGNGAVIYYDSTYIYLEFWQPQLAGGNSFPRAGAPPFHFEMITYV